MNIRINKPENNLFEAAPSIEPITEKELTEWLKNFPDDAKSWKDATGELASMHAFLAESAGGTYQNAKNPDELPSVYNQFHKKKILQYWKKISGDRVKLAMFTERFGIWLREETHLFESDTSMDNKEDKAIDDVLDNRSKQFRFDNGAFMGSLISDVDSQFGLLWHDANTKNISGFLDSVGDFFKTSGVDITTADISRLRAHYEKYNWRKKLKDENVTL
jgi:hypothetical protein